MRKSTWNTHFFGYLLALRGKIFKFIRFSFLIGMVLIVGLLTVLSFQSNLWLNTSLNEGYRTGSGVVLGREYEVWNHDGSFDLPVFDTGNLRDICFIDSPWGGGSWGIEASSFDDGNGDPPLGYTKDEARFASFFGQNGYLYGRNESQEWSLVRFVQGDMFGGSNCGQIPWHVPEPLEVKDAEPVIYVDFYRD